MDMDERIKKLDKELNDIKQEIINNKITPILTKVAKMIRAAEAAKLKPIGVTLSSNLYYLVNGNNPVTSVQNLPVRCDISTYDMVSLEVTTND